MREGLRMEPQGLILLGGTNGLASDETRVTVLIDYDNVTPEILEYALSVVT